MLTMTDALALSSRLVALSVFVQTLELSWLCRSASPRAVLVAQGAGRFSALLALQLGLCGWVLLVGPSPVLLALFATYIALMARVAGPFNGGSDALSSLSLLLLGIAACDPWQSVIMHGALAYLGLSLLLSYFVAGLAKLKERGWRRGSALIHFASLPKYGVPAVARRSLARPGVARGLSWTVLLFECSSPLALLGPRVCLVYLTLGASFHAANAVLFGLNRFFFAWLATYPALLALSSFVPWGHGS
jgi:hypothetical protein